VLLHSFPDINAVRRLKGNATEGKNIWRNVVLNFRCREASRLSLESPYSLFINRSGYSFCNINGRGYRVETDNVLFAQPGDIYGLTIDNMNRTEICNVHITKQFFEEAAYAAIQDDATLLSSPLGSVTGLRLRSQFYEKDRNLRLVSDKLSQTTTYEEHMFEATLADLARVMICKNEEIAKRIALMPHARAAVREDIYRRLSIAKDYIHSNYHQPLNLDEIAGEVSMSKYHFLRSFKQHFSVSPFTYLANVRMQKAAHMLQFSDSPIYGISDSLGFEHPNSFIKAFTKARGMPPTRYRALAK